MACLVPPTLLSCGIEFSVHELPRQHRAEIAAAIPEVDLDGMLIIPTSQHSELDLVRTGDQIEAEKDFLLEKFMDFANAFCRTLVEAGYYADYFDPCSGLTMINRQNGGVYSEVDGFSTLLKYKTANAGCCKVLLHPRWGSHVYPASMVTRAPLDVAKNAIIHANDLLSNAEQQGSHKAPDRHLQS